MKILSAQQLKELDRYTIQNEFVEATQLIENAAAAFIEVLNRKFPQHNFIKVLAGVGNNGADGLAIARRLAETGEKVEVYVIRYSNNSTKEFEEQLQLLHDSKLQIPFSELKNGISLPEFKAKDLVIDAMIGNGISGPITGFTKDVIKHLNDSEARVIAVDLPTGLYPDHQNEGEDIVEADFTVSFQVAKLGLVFPTNYKWVGDWEVVPIGLSKKFIDDCKTDYELVDESHIKNIFKQHQRGKFDNKGTYGKGLLIAGSYGRMGAAVIAGKAAVKSGIGKLFVHVPESGVDILQTSLPEALLDIDNHARHITNFEYLEQYTQVAIGSGIGTLANTQLAVRTLLKSYRNSLIFDADAINILAENPDWLNLVISESIFTPHPKECDRLLGESANSYERLAKIKNFSKTHKIYVVLKGAHSAIACPDGKVYFNSTGNPGMATAGSGDALTGLLLSLRCQGFTGLETVLAAVYLHGLAGDYAAKVRSQLSVSAMDIIEFFPAAFKHLLQI